MIVSDRSRQDAGHWYTVQGAPCYTIKGTNGAQRNTTLKDARKLGLLPSVTGILNLAAKPALINWMIDQAILSALTLPKHEDESDESYLKRIKEDSKQQGLQAAERGTQIHNAVEDWFMGRTVAVEFIPFVDGVVKKLFDLYGDQEWVPEEAFGHALGFGGRVDLHVKPCKDFPYGLVVDIKTKEFTDPTTVKNFDEHLWQLAAYRIGLNIPDAIAANIFVSRTNPGLVHVCPWELQELDKGWDCFTALLEFWQIKNNYRPGLIP
jgi:hypothetical protein